MISFMPLTACFKFGHAGPRRHAQLVDVFHRGSLEGVHVEEYARHADDLVPDTIFEEDDAIVSTEAGWQPDVVEVREAP